MQFTLKIRFKKLFTRRLKSKIVCTNNHEIAKDINFQTFWYSIFTFHKMYKSLQGRAITVFTIKHTLIDLECNPIKIQFPRLHIDKTDERIEKWALM